jgi:hypothetical protein
MPRSLNIVGIAAAVLSTSTLLVSAAPEAVQLVRAKAPAGSLPPRWYANSRARNSLTSTPTSNDGVRSS